VIAQKSGLRRSPTTGRATLEFSLDALAQIDLLTELPNRVQFRDRLEGAIARATRSQQLLAVALLDLDHFRQVNHAFGQSQADLLLVAVAVRLQRVMRKGDTIARLGGDEFAVLLEGLHDAEGATIAGRRLLEAVAAPAIVAGEKLRITASIGTSVFPRDARDGDGLMRTADLALWHAKEGVGNLCESYSPALETGIARDAARREDTVSCMARLTPRERQVLDILVAGKASKMIAYLLGTSPRTIESHRANIMTKMRVHSVPELVRRVVEVGVSSAAAVHSGAFSGQNVS
jgi:diguanylate cyclase (GGDEF)-like protein